MVELEIFFSRFFLMNAETYKNESKKRWRYKIQEDKERAGRKEVFMLGLFFLHLLRVSFWSHLFVRLDAVAVMAAAVMALLTVYTGTVELALMTVVTKMLSSDLILQSLDHFFVHWLQIIILLLLLIFIIVLVAAILLSINRVRMVVIAVRGST